MKLTDRFTFGKYKGERLKDVCANHGSYVGWCIENIDGFCIEPENIHKEFVKGYNQWKNSGCTGLTVKVHPGIGLNSIRNVPVVKTLIDNMHDGYPDGFDDTID